MTWIQNLAVCKNVFFYIMNLMPWVSVRESSRYAKKLTHPIGTARHWDAIIVSAVSTHDVKCFFFKSKS
jgi:hypothetical protein